ncbi:ABC transporter permease [Paenibacillus sp. FSL M7-0802]|nr:MULTISPECIES: ABC transporter permease [Paenibacillus]MCP3794777.1 ABC transporter permease [Paenibacillus sp. CH40]
MQIMQKYFLNFNKYRYLLKQLVINDIKIKYRRSILGVIWSVLQPLMMMIVLTMVFASLFKSNIPHFAIYVLTGRIIWDLFSSGTIMAMDSVVGNASLIKKVYIPKYIFPLSKCFSSLVNTAFALIALVIVAIVSGGVKLTPNLFLIPIPLFYTFLFGVGLSFILSAYTVFFRDLKYLYEVLLTAWMYFTPQFFPMSIIPDNLKIVFELNPLYYTLQMFRDVVMYGVTPTLQQHLICASIGVVTLIIGLLVFRRKQDDFILYI